MTTEPRPIALPVTAVTCLEDRAHVERTADLDLTAGVQRLRLGPVSALAVDRTLHAELASDRPAAVLGARIVRTWTPRDPVPPPGTTPPSACARTPSKGSGAPRSRSTTGCAPGSTCWCRLAADLLREIREGVGSGESEGSAGPGNWTAWTPSATRTPNGSAPPRSD